jgi:hypothetical protein
LKARFIRMVGAGFMLISLVGAPAQESRNQRTALSGSSELVKITPESLDFGTRPVGSLTPPKTAVLANHGPKSLTITDIVTSGIDFAQTNACGQSLAPGADCTIQITFKPAIPGPRIATVQILDSDPASPQSIVLNGTGR